MRKCCIILIFCLLLIIGGGNLITEASSPEISGDLEIGDRLYLDTDDGEDILDQYHYRRFWLKYKRRLDRDEYYYIKGQLYRKEYQVKTTYNSKTIDLWGNYTKRLTERFRNRWKFNLKDKDYYLSQIKSYRAYRLNCQFDFDYNQKQRYTIYLQRQWNNYYNNEIRDYTRDKCSLDWRYKVSDHLQFSTTGQIENQFFSNPGDSSNKVGKKLSFGFKYKL